MISARVIQDSVSPEGVRLTTIEATFHRFILAEYNTHRVFSRNSASSRAIPIKKQIDKLLTNPALPVEWGKNKSGMQASDVLSAQDELEAIAIWLQARDTAVAYAERLSELGVHKQIVNRLLEPFMWHTVITTSTEWDNFFKLRCNPDAQPEMTQAANAIRHAYMESYPEQVSYGQWHTPYFYNDQDLPLSVALEVSAARCARVSYLTHDGIIDIAKDMELYNRLVSAPHESPLEHVATPALPGEKVLGNFNGWHQLRHRGM